MTILIPTLAVAFAAFCVWLAVRTINRRERWAKWMLGIAVGLPVLYALSFGPACWIASRTRTADSKFFVVAYWPMWWALHRDVPVVDDILMIYAAIGMQSGDSLQIPSVGRLPNEEWDETTMISVK